MIWLLQYYKKNTNFLKGLFIILIHLTSLNVFSLDAIFEATQVNKCPPSRVIFTNQSTTGAGIDFIWDFDLGALVPSNEIIQEQVYLEPGDYTITLYAIEGSDTVTSDTTITVSLGPVAQFDNDFSAGCIPLTVRFTNTSTQGDAAISSVVWDLRDGNTYYSTDYIDKTYNTSGFYSALIIVTDMNGCKDYLEKNDLIEIYDQPVPNFHVSDSFSCNAPLFVNFVNQTNEDAPLNYLWNFGNGITSTQRDTGIFYMEEGDYTVSLKAENENGCNAEITKNNYISVGDNRIDIVADHGYKTITNSDTICEGEVIFKPSVLQNIIYHWRVIYNSITIDTIADSLYFESIESDSVKITLKYGEGTLCPDSVTKVFYIDQFEVDFEMVPDYSCNLQSTVNLTSYVNNAEEIIWIFPYNQFSYDSTTTYELNITEAYYNKYNHDLNIYSLPFTLHATKNNGCQNSNTKLFTANVPLARFLPDKVSGCIPLEVTFTDKSLSDEDITKRTFNIDGQIIERPDNSPFTHTFEEPGKYEIFLIIENELGCSDTSYSIFIEAGDKVHPDISLSKTKVCIGDSLYITGISEFMDSLNVWHFSSEEIFNSSSSDSMQGIKVMSPTVGSKDIEIETSYNGCVSDTVIENAFYVSGPAGQFFEEFLCESPYDYTFNSVIDQATSLNWQIAGETIFDQDTIDYSFTTSGDYNIKLTAVNDTSGCTLVKNKTIQVRKVVADFVRDSINCGLTLDLDASVSNDYIDTCYNEAFLWDFGDNSRKERVFDPVLTHYYYQKGDYIITLIVTADNGCSDTISKPVKIIYFEPEFIVDKDSGCAPDLEINFTKTSNNPDIVLWTWYYGDGDDRIYGTNVSHEYNSPVTRIFVASLEETDKYGCEATTSKIITIFNPNASFYATDVKLCPGQQTNFILYDAAINIFDIDFGDGTSSTTNLTHNYYAIGDYDVSMTVTHNGCTNTFTRADYISVIDADAHFEVNDSVFDCYPATVTFNHNSTNEPIINGTWTYDNGSTGSYNEISEYIYSEPGVYTTSLWIETYNHCTATFEKTITVTGPDANIIIPQGVVCYGEPINFSMTNLTNTDNYTWYFGDGTTSNEASPQHQYYADGTFTPTLILKKDECEVSKTNGDIFVQLYQASFDINNTGSNYCENDYLELTNTSPNPATSNWYLNDQLISSALNPPSINLTTIGTNEIKLIAQNINNCVDTVTTNIIVIESPDFSITGDELICPGETGNLSVEAESGWTIVWQPQTSVSDPNSFSPVISPDSSLFYTATVSNNNCITSKSIYVTVPEELSFEQIPSYDTTINLGQSIMLSIITNDENVTYQWQPDYKISCINCSNPIVSPHEYTTYTVVIQDQCGSATAYFNIDVYSKNYIKAPAAFTPNGDGNNDVFMLETFNISELIEFKIYNRWGNLVFSTNSLDEGWDGKVRGKLQNADTYAYFVRAMNIFGFEVKKSGSVILLK